MFTLWIFLDSNQATLEGQQRKWDREYCYYSEISVHHNNNNYYHYVLLLLLCLLRLASAGFIELVSYEGVDATVFAYAGYITCTEYVDRIQ